MSRNPETKAHWRLIAKAASDVALALTGSFYENRDGTDLQRIALEKLVKYGDRLDGQMRDRVIAVALRRIDEAVARHAEELHQAKKARAVLESFPTQLHSCGGAN